jgi:hypothetical protein
MVIAIQRVVMHLSEIITIYLAAGAPFGVHYFFQKRAQIKSALGVLKVIGVTLCWPLIATRYFLSKRKKAIQSAKNVPDERLEQIRRALYASLQIIREFVGEQRIKESRRLEELLYVIRESAEKYSGLARFVDDLDERGVPSKHELEIFRVSEREGKDLSIAGQCLHRRNVRQLVKHRNHARALFVHALVETQEIANEINSSSLINAVKARQLSEALLQLYDNAIELLSLIEDQKAVMIVARLLDKESDRLREIEAAISNEQEVFGEERCSHIVRQPFAQTSQQTTPTRS